MQYEIFNVHAGSGWQNANLSTPINQGDQLAIIPMRHLGNDLQASTSDFSATPNGPNNTVSVQVGDEITIEASGTWCWTGGQCVGPAGSSQIAGSGFTLPGAHKWSLIGRVGSGAWFYIGDTYTFTATTSGTLELLMNDDVRGDNSGALSVSITTTTGCGLLSKVGSGTNFTVSSELRRYSGRDR